MSKLRTNMQTRLFVKLVCECFPIRARKYFKLALKIGEYSDMWIIGRLKSFP